MTDHWETDKTISSLSSPSHSKHQVLVFNLLLCSKKCSICREMGSFFVISKTKPIRCWSSLIIFSWLFLPKTKHCIAFSWHKTVPFVTRSQRNECNVDRSASSSVFKKQMACLCSQMQNCILKKKHLFVVGLFGHCCSADDNSQHLDILAFWQWHHLHSCAKWAFSMHPIHCKRRRQSVVVVNSISCNWTNFPHHWTSANKVSKHLHVNHIFQLTSLSTNFNNSYHFFWLANTQLAACSCWCTRPTVLHMAGDESVAP